MDTVNKLPPQLQRLLRKAIHLRSEWLYASGPLIARSGLVHGPTSLSVHILTALEHKRRSYSDHINNVTLHHSLFMSAALPSWTSRKSKLLLWVQELEKGEDDIIEVAMRDASLVVNELKVKVDLTKFTERHVFNFDDALDESVGNDEVYRSTVQPLVATIFKNGKATCFAYGQTGSGKTFTMQPLPMRAARDMFALLEDPQFADLSLFVSCFEIYGGKLYDLLNARKRLDMREDGKKRVCIVDLKARSTVNSLPLYDVWDTPHSVNHCSLLSSCAAIPLTLIVMYMLLTMAPALFAHLI